MPSDKLKKYLAYYQKTLRDDPENIEARLRLAALFREMGSIAHAIEEYVTASKLLAAQGLPLEAIAACKAVLELDPTHTEVQLFLARLFAQAPDAAGHGARVARPVSSPVTSAPRRTVTPAPPVILPQQKIEQLSTDEMQAFERSGAQPITLAQPKSPEHADLPDIEDDSEPEEDAIPTGVHQAIDPPPMLDATRAQPANSIQGALDASRSTRVATHPLPQEATPPASEQTVMIPLDEQTNMLELEQSAQGAISFAASPEEIARLRSQVSEEMKETVEFSYLEEMNKKAGVDLIGIEASPPSILKPEPRRKTLSIKPISRDPKTTGKWHPQDRDPFKAELEEGLGASTEPLADDEPAEEQEEETFNLKVFDMPEVDFGDADMASLLDEISDGVKDRLDEMDSEPYLSDGESKQVHISRDELPEIPLFSGVNQRAFLKFLGMVEAREYEAGEPIVLPGESYKCIFIIARGKAQACKTLAGEELFLGEFVEGDFFGEFELLTGRRGAARILASTRTVVLIVSEDAINSIAEEDPEIWDTLWDVYHIRMLNNLMASDTIFRHLSSTTRDEVLDLFEIEEHPPGSVVLSPEEACRFVCLVLFGELEIEPTDARLPRKTLREGEFFGFVASLSDEGCRATITSTQDTTLLCLSASFFRKLTRQHAGIAREIRSMLSSRVTRNDLFLTGITRYADTGLEN